MSILRHVDLARDFYAEKEVDERLGGGRDVAHENQNR
jgi:hypothetical protein